MDRRTGDEWSGDPLLLAALQRYVEPVSYTHLDVYKRQRLPKKYEFTI